MTQQSVFSSMSIAFKLAAVKTCCRPPGRAGVREKNGAHKSVQIQIRLSLFFAAVVVVATQAVLGKTPSACVGRQRRQRGGRQKHR